MNMLWTDFKNQLFENEALKIAFEANELKFKIIKKLLEYLKSNNITQEQFSKKLGVKQQVISRFIKGEINPRFDFIAKIFILLDGEISFQDEKKSLQRRSCIVDLTQFRYKEIKTSGDNEYQSTKTAKKGA